MPSIDTDTRLVMTILFVGAVSGINIYFYSQYGMSFPYGAEEHAVLFGIGRLGKRRTERESGTLSGSSNRTGTRQWFRHQTSTVTATFQI